LRLYAETSAVLRWLLGEPGADEVRTLLASAERVLASHLTIVECERALVRLTNVVAPVDRAALREALAQAAAAWMLVEIDAPIRARASQPFPVEPVRTLDALHLATVLELLPFATPLQVLSVDARVVDNARAFGIAVVPDA
jgi:uncharacterized protein with PIN domain